MAFAFTAAEIEDGTGKVGSVVYEDTAAVIARLADLGKTSLAGGTATANGTQENSMRNGTAYIESAFEPHFRGAPVVPGDTGVLGQGLIWPALGALSARGIEFIGDAIPEEYLRPVALAIEEEHAGTLRPAGARNRTISEETDSQGTIKYHDATPDLAATHPALWRDLKRALPPIMF